MGGACGMQAGRALAGPTPVQDMLWRVKAHVVVLVVVVLQGCVSGWKLAGPISTGSPVVGECRSVPFLGCFYRAPRLCSIPSFGQSVGVLHSVGCSW
jgi:hypothetical protein